MYQNFARCIAAAAVLGGAAILPFAAIAKNDDQTWVMTTSTGKWQLTAAPGYCKMEFEEPKHRPGWRIALTLDPSGKTAFLFASPEDWIPDGDTADFSINMQVIPGGKVQVKPPSQVLTAPVTVRKYAAQAGWLYGGAATSGWEDSFAYANAIRVNSEGKTNSVTFSLGDGNNAAAMAKLRECYSKL